MQMPFELTQEPTMDHNYYIALTLLNSDMSTELSTINLYGTRLWKQRKVRGAFIDGFEDIAENPQGTGTDGRCYLDLAIQNYCLAMADMNDRYDKGAQVNQLENDYNKFIFASY